MFVRYSNGAIDAISEITQEALGITTELPGDHADIAAYRFRLENPVPGEISDRQFFQQLAALEVITTQEALDAVKVGAIPSALQGIIDQLPSEERFAAEMLLSGATIFRRDHPLTAAIGAAQNYTEDQIDEFFRAAFLL